MIFPKSHGCKRSTERPSLKMYYTVNYGLFKMSCERYLIYIRNTDLQTMNYASKMKLWDGSVVVCEPIHWRF